MIFLLLPALLAGCREPEPEQQAVQTSAEALPQLHLEVTGPWELSIIPAKDGGFWVASFSHSDNYVAVWSINDQRSGRLVARADTGHHPDDIYWIDWDKDGVVNELLVTVEGAGMIELWRFSGDKLESIASRKVLVPPRTIAVEDLDQDQRADLVLGPYDDTKVTLLWGDVFKDNVPEQPIQAKRTPTYPKIVDWNKDNLPDLVWSEWDAEGAIRLAKNLGGREFKTIALTPPLPQAPRQATIADVNNDGWPDILVGLEAGKKALILYNGGNEKITKVEEIAAPLAGYSEVIAHRLGGSDGELMLAMSETHVIVFAKRDQNGQWIMRQIDAVSAQSLTFFDADHDGIDDLAFVTYTGVHIVYGPLWEKATPLDL